MIFERREIVLLCLLIQQQTQPLFDPEIGRAFRILTWLSLSLMNRHTINVRRGCIAC